MPMHFQALKYEAKMYYHKKIQHVNVVFLQLKQYEKMAVKCTCIQYDCGKPVANEKYSL